MATARRLLIAAALVVPLLVGCGGDPAAPGSAPRAADTAHLSNGSAASGTPSAPATAATSAPDASSEAQPGATQKGRPRALFFGDSYFIGGGYTGAGNSMAAIAARRLGWQASIRGGGGTGFVSGNAEYAIPNFIGQIRGGALDVGPVKWLVIEGGGNDKYDQPGLIERRAKQVLRAAAKRHPEARLVLVGTLDPTVDGFDDTDGVIGALASAASSMGVPYINAQRWLEGRPQLIGPDYDHPTVEGHRVAGRKLARALKALR